jgi:hypothetical protein
MADNIVETFLRDPDQSARLLELRAYLGPNPESFLALYARMRAQTGRTAAKAALLILTDGLCAPAFFLGPVWFFYRKLWFWATAIVALMLLLAAIPGATVLGLPLGILLALIARRAYLHHAIRTITLLRTRSGLPGTEDEHMLTSSDYDDDPGIPSYLQAIHAAGGVSHLAGWISGAVYLAITLATLLTHLPART